MTNFKDWFYEMVGTYAIYDPKVKPKTFNWWGAVGSSGKSIEGDPIKRKKNVKLSKSKKLRP